MRNQFITMLALSLTLAACGEDGKDGVDGTSGADGTSGSDGADGADGATGEDGEDGLCSDATPVEITGITGMTADVSYVDFTSDTMTIESNAAGALTYTVAGFGLDYAWDGDNFTVTPTSEEVSSQVIIATDGCTTATYQFDLDAEYGVSFINIVHLFEGAPSVDVGVAGGTADEAFLTDFEFATETGYIGAYSTPGIAFDLFAEGALAATTGDIALMPNAAYTLVVHPDTGAVATILLEDDLSATSAEDVVRLTAVHAADGVGQVDIWETATAAALFTDLDFGTSDTAEVPAIPVLPGIDADDDGDADYVYAADLTGLAGLPTNAIAFMAEGEPRIFVSAPIVEYSAVLNPACDAAGGTECGSSSSVSIPDYGDGVLTDSILVGGTCLVDVITMSVDIDHSYLGDVEGTLTAPDGTVVTIFDGRGYGADRLVGTFASDSSGYAEYNYTGSSYTYEYAQPDMSSLLGVSAEGSWTLSIEDTFSGDTGTLNSWGLTFSCL